MHTHFFWTFQTQVMYQLPVGFSKRSKHIRDMLLSVEFWGHCFWHVYTRKVWVCRCFCGTQHYGHRHLETHGSLHYRSGFFFLFLKTCGIVLSLSPSLNSFSTAHPPPVLAASLHPKSPRGPLVALTVARSSCVAAERTACRALLRNSWKRAATRIRNQRSKTATVPTDRFSWLWSPYASSCM